MKVFNILHVISKHYKEISIPEKKIIIIKDRNSLHSTTFTFNTIIGRVFFVCYENLIELLKSKIKKRPPLYKSIFVTTARVPGDIYGNLTFGTFVVVFKSGVDKFYLKNKSDYYGLYKSLGEYELNNNIDYLVLNMPRYENLGLLDKSIISGVEKYIGKAKVTYEDTQHLSLVSNLINIFISNRKSIDKNFLKSANLLQEKAKKLGLEFSHGDLWKANIMLDNDKVVLIDFDKAMWFLKGYDFVYLYCMERQLSRDWSVASMLDKVEELFSEYESLYFPSMDYEHFEINLRAVVLLKSAERAVFNNDFDIDSRLLK